MIRLLALAAALAAAQPAAKPALLPRLWARASVPAGWSLVGEDVWREGSGPGAATLSVVFVPGKDAAAWLRSRAELSAAEKRAQRLVGVNSGAIEYQGPWALVRTVEVGRDGSRRRVLHAALPAPGGLYAVDAPAAEKDWARVEPQVLAFLDGFRREPPPLRFERRRAAGKFSLEAPAAPWTDAGADADADARFIAPRGPGGGAPGMLTVKAAGSGEAESLLRQLCPGGRPVGRRDRRGVLRISEGREPAPEAMPEAPEASAEPASSRCAVLESGGRSYVIAWLAAGPSYEYGLAAFDRAVRTLAPER